jgi:hypothetical protein
MALGDEYPVSTQTQPATLHPCVNPSLLDCLSTYLYDLYIAKFRSGSDEVAAAAAVFPPDGLTLEVQIDCKQLSTALAVAHLTPSSFFIFT